MPNTIPCPYCRNIIYFDLALLLKGEAFECSVSFQNWRID